MSVRGSQIRIEVPAGGRRVARLVGAEEFEGRLPIDAVVEGGRPLLRWLDMGGARLDEPFFEQTVGRVRRERPHGEEWFTDFDALVQLEKTSDAPRPGGFIFHSSRCGSTVVANACRALDGARVVSEAAPVDKLVWPYLAGDGGATQLLRRVFLRAVVGLFARGAEGRRFFVKFSCCSVLRLSFVRSIWQDVPLVFVYRDPVEVMVSNLRDRPDWMRFESQPEMAAAVSGAGEAEAVRMSPEEFCARALGRFYDAAHAGAGDARAMFLGYEELSAAKLEEVVRFFGVTPTPAESARIEATTRLYAKDAARARRFEPDGEEKRAAASPLVRDAAARWAAGPYRRLLALKAGASVIQK